MRELVQSTEEDGYALVVLAYEGLNLLSEDEIENYSGKVLCEQIIGNCKRFAENTCTTPTCVSVTGSVKALVAKHIKYGKDGDLVGEMREVQGQYDDDPYLHIQGEDGYTHSVHVSSNCKVGKKHLVTITGVRD